MRILWGLTAENPSVKYVVIDRKSFSQKSSGRWICRSISGRDEKVSVQLLFFGSKRNIGRAMIHYDRSLKFSVRFDNELRGVPRGEKIDYEKMETLADFKGSATARKALTAKIGIKVPDKVYEAFQAMVMAAYVRNFAARKYTPIYGSYDEGAKELKPKDVFKEKW